MKSADILSKTDRTSWSRIAMVWRFYRPCVAWQLWAWPLLSLISFVLCQYVTSPDHILLYSMGMSLLALAFTFAPLAFASRNGREVEAMLPALALEKSIVIIGYSLVVSYLLLDLPFELLTFIVNGESAQSLVLDSLKNDPATAAIVDKMASIPLSAVSYVSALVAPLTCLWGVFGAKRHRAKWGLLSVVILYAAVTVISMLISFGTGIYIGVQEAAKGAENVAMANLDPTQIALSLIRIMVYILVPVTIFYIIFAVRKCHRAISRQQF